MNGGDGCRAQYVNGEARAHGALEQVVVRSAEVAGIVGAAGVHIVVGQARRGVGRRNHQHAGFADDRHCALRRARAGRANHADNALVCRRALGSRLSALSRAQAVFDDQLDFAAQQHAVAGVNGDFDAAARVLAIERSRAGHGQERADDDRVIRTDFDAAELVHAVPVGHCRQAECEEQAQCGEQK